MAEPTSPPTTALEERMARLEGTMEQMNYRIGSLETRMVSLENGQIQIRQELSTMRSELTNKIDSNFHWIVGIMLTTWVTLAALIIGVLLQK